MNHRARTTFFNNFGARTEADPARQVLIRAPTSHHPLWLRTEFAGRHGDPGRMVLYVGPHCTGLTLRVLERLRPHGLFNGELAIKRFEEPLARESKLQKITRRLLAEK